MTHVTGSRTSDLPPIEDLLDELAAIAEVGELDPDLPLDGLEAIGVDSLDLLEWLYGVGDRYGIEIDETVFERLDEDATLRSVYDPMAAAAAAAP